MSGPHVVEITYIGGPTALISYYGLRLLTDPTFDSSGEEYVSGPSTLRKLADPAISVDRVGPVDIVLLSHDQHSDNLDRAGREILSRASKVFTTAEGARRLGGNAVGFVPWQTVELKASDGTLLLVTATPARHGPFGSEGRSGPVVGFVLRPAGRVDAEALYFSGDTVWYEGVAAVARWFNITMALLNMGAANVQAAGPAPLTMTAADAVQAAGAMPNATIVPLHFEGWAHFTESRQVIQQTFEEAGLEGRLRWISPSA